MPEDTSSPTNNSPEAPTDSRPRFRYFSNPATAESWTVEEREFHGRRSLFFHCDAGFVRIRHYPQDWMTLPDERLAALLPNVGNLTLPVATAPSDPVRRLRILIIDDNAADRYVAKRLLERAIGDVFEADAPDAGVEKALVIDPDLILLDYNMPGVQGTSGIERLKAEPKLTTVPVVWFTGYAESLDVQTKALAQGVIDKTTFSPDIVAPLIAAALQPPTQSPPT
jgi:CheY-like chemotaxis protein